jgi:hypothetical protein
MAEHTCFNCMYCVCEPCLWLSLMRSGEPILPRCANHPQWPGQLHEVPGVPCRNYRSRPVLPEGDSVRMIALTDGSYAYVDAEDYDELNQWKWHLDKGYATRTDKGKVITMHRQIMQPPKGKVVDHFDGNRAHNCRTNLRFCTNAQNMRNRRKCSGASSVYKGVYYNRQRHKWSARCHYRGEPSWLGHFDSEIEAARAYDRKAVELFGEFARLNFPREWPPERRAAVWAQRQEPQETSKAKGKSRKAKVKRRKAKSKTSTARAEPALSAVERATRGRREQKRPPKSARAPAAKSGQEGKREKSKAAGRR